MHRSADVLEWIWRALARRPAVVAVGPELSSNYAHAPAVHELVVSLVPAAALERPAAMREDYAGELSILSVGRLDQEKNPLLLADVLALLRRRDPRWRLRVCGEGDLAAALAGRLSELGVAQICGDARLRPDGRGAVRAVSLESRPTARVIDRDPQVLVEAFACGLPIVATDVGGVRDGVGDAALLMPPGDPDAAADALERVAADRELRAGLTDAGSERAAGLTLESQIADLVAFLEAARRR